MGWCVSEMIETISSSLAGKRVHTCSPQKISEIPLRPPFVSTCQTVSRSIRHRRADSAGDLPWAWVTLDSASAPPPRLAAACRRNGPASIVSLLPHTSFPLPKLTPSMYDIIYQIDILGDRCPPLTTMTLSRSWHEVDGAFFAPGFEQAHSMVRLARLQRGQESSTPIDND